MKIGEQQRGAARQKPSSKQYDVIVIGGGPAGASAASRLVQAGRCVLLLEQESIPRPKPCAGAVPKAALRAFPFSCEEAFVATVTAVGCAWREKEPRFVPVSPEVIVLVDRARFDAHLLAHCGAAVRDRSPVAALHPGSSGVIVEMEAGGSFTAADVVLACGAGSLLPESLGIPSSPAVPCLVVEMDAPSLLERLRGRPSFTFGLVPRGYFWLFPKGDRLSAGLFTARRGVPDLRGILRQALGRWGLPGEEAAVRAHPVPLYRPGWPRRAGRVLLAGDAAVLADPFLGEGIRHATHSGWLAAEAILQGRPELYPHWVEATIGRALRGARVMAHLAYALPRMAAWFLGTRPGLSTGFGHFFQGQLGYTGLLARLPLYLVQRT